MSARRATPFALSLAVGAVLFTTPARAADHDPPPSSGGDVAPVQPIVAKIDVESEVPSPPEPERTFYGWQNLTVAYSGLAISIGSISMGRRREPNEGTAVGLVIYGLGGPIVHWAHGHVGRGFAALGLDVALPLVGGLIGSTGVHCTGNEECEPDFSPLVIGFMVGALAAPLIDSFTMGYEDAPAAPTGLASIKPSVRIAQKDEQGIATTTFGLGGMF